MVTDVLDTLESFGLDQTDEERETTIAGDQWPVGILLASDFLAAAMALPLSLLLLSLGSPGKIDSLGHFWINVRTDASFPVAITLALAFAGFYRSRRRAPYESSFSELKELAIALCAGCVIAIAFSVILHVSFGITESDSTQLLLASMASIVLIAGARGVIGAFRRGVYSRVLIVGSDSLVDRITAYADRTKGVEVVGRVVDTLASVEGSLGTVSDLPQLCEKLQANRIIIAYPTSISQESIAIFRSLPPSVHISIVPRYFELVSWRSRIADLHGLPLIEVAPAHLSRWDRFLKRAFDVVASSLLLLILAPLALTLAVLVKLSSSGPIFFRQERVGRGRQLFTIYKFRTMVEADSPGVESNDTRTDDTSTPLHEVRHKAIEATRITPIGRVMRRTGLDEIPQFVNVLCGNMSLVGPRPFKECESETISGWQARRFEFRPGITGLWQVSGRNDLSLDDLRRLDYLYVASWSLWWDVKIACDTPRAMVRGFGAY
jgi:exopolysaccharide biosynthesis polyprenyl glycosylphosphotransferase